MTKVTLKIKFLFKFKKNSKNKEISLFVERNHNRYFFRSFVHFFKLVEDFYIFKYFFVKRNQK